LLGVVFKELVTLKTLLTLVTYLIGIVNRNQVGDLVTDNP
jgi:hypothetical protein